MKWLLLLAGGVLLATACSEGRPSWPPRPVPPGLFEDARAQQAGSLLFLEKCASCHGSVAEGRTPKANSYVPPPMDFSESRYSAIDPAYLYWRIEVGKNVEPYASQGSVMPAWGLHFSEEQIWQLVAHLKSRSSSR